MYVSYNWLKEYIDFDLEPKVLAEKLTSSGIAVETIQYLSEGITNVVVGYVEECGKHPDADKLSLCKISDGEESHQVICGAKNIKAGIKIPFAKIGAILPGDFKIKKAKLRGVESFGMVCSAKELGMDVDLLLPEQKDGILILDDDAQVGSSALDYLGLNDYLLELDLTPDRGDCLSVINVARQIGGIIGKKVNFPEISYTESEKEVQNNLEIVIEDEAKCPRYVGMVVEDVTIKPSPFWMQAKLRSAGIRPISNVVDITNYILLELGQPLHSFDADRIAGNKIIVRSANKDEKITTLDDQERVLDENMLLICDAEKPVAIAGVMGGQNTEVSDETKNVVIEAAYFDPTNIRTTATKVGIRSEASIRFEKGINFEQTEVAAKRAVQLLEQLADGKVMKGSIDVYPNKLERAEINLRFQKVNDVLGTCLTKEEIKEILVNLEIEIVSEDEEKAVFRAPAFRPDLKIEEDLVEEVAGIFGLDNIPTTLPVGNTNKGRRTFNQKVRKSIYLNLSALGLNEVVNYSFINESNLDKMELSENDKRREAVRVLNPLSEEQGIMRTSLLPGMLETSLRNYNRRNEDQAFFELGKVFFANGFPEKAELPKEQLHLAAFVKGTRGKDWSNQGEEVDFFYLKGILDNLFEVLKVEGIEYVQVNNVSEYHPGRCAKVLYEGEFLGYIGEVHPKVIDNYGLNGKNYALELNLEKLINACENKVMYKQLPKYPATSRDLAILVDEEVRAADLIRVIEKSAGELLEMVNVFDLYQGEQVPEGKKSIAFSLKFQADDRTLTDDEINKIFENIRVNLEQDFDAKLRD